MAIWAIWAQLSLHHAELGWQRSVRPAGLQGLKDAEQAVWHSPETVVTAAARHHQRRRVSSRTPPLQR